VVSGASGSFALAGRWPQCMQQRPAVAWERTRDSTAVNEGIGVEAGAGGRLRRDGGDHVVDETWRCS